MTIIFCMCTMRIYLFAKLLTEIKETKSYKTSEIKSNDLETLSKYNNLNNLSKSKISNILNSLNWAITDNEIPKPPVGSLKLRREAPTSAHLKSIQ